jgi:hypothetical protein
MRATLLVCLLTVPTLLAAQSSGDINSQKAAIERAQNVLVSTFDSSLPKVTLKFFLESESEGAKIEWEVNDCGEQTGDAAVDRGRDIPTCVEANLKLKDQRSVAVMVAVGSVKKGLSGSPSLFSSTVTDENGSHSVRLIELPAQIHRGRPKRAPAGRAPEVGSVVS